MEKPIIIWTLRRTGGTSLAEFLFKSSTHSSVQHEPFNTGRIWGDVTVDLRNQLDQDMDQMIDWDLAQFRERISLYCQQKRNIKHTIDNTPFLITKFLLEASLEQDYNHIVLLRKDNFKRIISLLIAQQTVWKMEGDSTVVFSKIISGELDLQKIPFKKLQKNFNSSIQKLGGLYELLHQNNVDYYRVYFEELFSDQLGQQQRLDKISNILNYLNIKEYDSQHLYKNLFESSENTKSIYEYIPNYHQLEALSKFYGII